MQLDSPEDMIVDDKILLGRLIKRHLARILRTAPHPNALDAACLSLQVQFMALLTICNGLELLARFRVLVSDFFRCATIATIHRVSAQAALNSFKRYTPFNTCLCRGVHAKWSHASQK